MMKSYVLIVFLEVLCGVFSREIPSYIHLCKRHDPEINKCFMNAMNEIRPYLKKGIPEMDLPPGDPLHYYDLSAATGQGTSTKLEGTSWNQTAEGVTDYEIKSVSIDIDNYKIETKLVLPRLRLQGEYHLKGEVLLFRIDSSGLFDINDTNVGVDLEWTGKPHQKNGKTYLKFDKYKLTFHPNKVSTHFTNIIPGNDQLTETINQAVNENMDVMIQDLLPLISETFGGLVNRYFSQVFRLFSIDELFPEK